jgi:hypothetical protein
MPDKRETWLIPPEGRKDVGKHVFAVLNTIIEDKQQLGLHKKWNENYVCGKMITGGRNHRRICH